MRYPLSTKSACDKCSPQFPQPDSPSAFKHSCGGVEISSRDQKTDAGFICTFNCSFWKPWNLYFPFSCQAKAQLVYLSRNSLQNSFISLGVARSRYQPLSLRFIIDQNHTRKFRKAKILVCISPQRWGASHLEWKLRRSWKLGTW